MLPTIKIKISQKKANTIYNFFYEVRQWLYVAETEISM